MATRAPEGARRADGEYRERASRLVPGAVLWTRSDPVAADQVRVLPDGCLDLIWVTRGGQGPDELLVAGPDVQAHQVDAARGTRYVGLRWAPGTGPAMLGVPAHELVDQRVRLEDLWPAGDVRRLADRLACPSPAQILEQVAATALREGAPGAPRSAPRLDAALLAVVGALRAGSTVGAAAAGAGLGERQLHRRSLVALGYGPKTLARILRLLRALDLARTGTPAALTAAQAGFADQAHLAREVRSLTGLSLGALLRGTED